MRGMYREIGVSRTIFYITTNPRAITERGFHSTIEKKYHFEGNSDIIVS